MSGVAGRLLGVGIGGSFVRCEISSTINFTQEQLAAAAYDSGRWNEFIVGARGWSITVNAQLLLAAVGSDIKNVLVSNYFDSLPLFVQFSTRPNATEEMLFSGAANMASGDISAASTENAKFTLQLQGTGPLAYKLQNYDLLINAMPPSANYPIIVNENL